MANRVDHYWLKIKINVHLNFIYLKKKRSERTKEEKKKKHFHVSETEKVLIRVVLSIKRSVFFGDHLWKKSSARAFRKCNDCLVKVKKRKRKKMK